MEENQPLQAPGGLAPKLQITTSRQFPAWLKELDAGIAFTTYQAGKLFLLGADDNNRLTAFERTFERCMGLWADAGLFVMSTVEQIWRFTNTLPPGQDYRGYRQLFVPRMSYTTGDIDVHDLALDASGRTVFVNTLFSCLAVTDQDNSFRPIWKPPFISRLAAEDRCHLNGMAMADGWPRYVTAISASDIADGWRDNRAGGGILIDVDSDEIILTGLSMPHSPRRYRDKLWVLNSGTGDFGYVDLDAGRFEPVAFCAGYARGLAFIDKFAVVGLSKPRHDGSFSGLPLDDRLAEHKVQPRCGLQVIDLDTGDIVHWLRIGGAIEELYDTAILPGATRPAALGFKSNEIRRTISSGPEAPLRPN